MRPAMMEPFDPLKPRGSGVSGGFARHAQAGLMREMQDLLPRLEHWSAAGSGGMGMVFKAWHPDLTR